MGRPREPAAPALRPAARPSPPLGQSPSPLPFSDLRRDQGGTEGPLVHCLSLSLLQAVRALPSRGSLCTYVTFWGLSVLCDRWATVTGEGDGQTQSRAGPGLARQEVGRRRDTAFGFPSWTQAGGTASHAPRQSPALPGGSQRGLSVSRALGAAKETPHLATKPQAQPQTKTQYFSGGTRCLALFTEARDRSPSWHPPPGPSSSVVQGRRDPPVQTMQDACGRSSGSSLCAR